MKENYMKGRLNVTRVVIVICVAVVAMSCTGAPEWDLIVKVDSKEHRITEEVGTICDVTLTVSSRMQTTVNGYAFLYASNDYQTPPARSIYPARAFVNLTERRQFHLTDHRKGQRIVIHAGESITIPTSVIYPSKWYDGTPISPGTFKDFRFMIYDDVSGKRVFEYIF